MNGIRNPDRIGIARKIVIPEPDGLGHDGRSADAGDALEGDVLVDMHVVRDGETLRDIADRYRTTIWAIAELNGLRDLDMIGMGRHLRIPQE
jgi:hypothetical protein